MSSVVEPVATLPSSLALCADVVWAPSPENGSLVIKSAVALWDIEAPSHTDRDHERGEDDLEKGFILSNS